MRPWWIAIAAAILGLIVGVVQAVSSVRNPGDELTRFLADPLPPENVISVDNAAKLVVVNGEDYNFGVMDRGDTREHTFVFRNEGSRSLTLGKPETTCMCMLPDVEKGGIPPGESRKVVLRWTPKKHELDFRQTATIPTSDPRRRVVTLNVYGRVVPRSRSVPATLQLGSITVNRERQTQAIIYGYQTDILDVSRTRWLRPELADYFDVDFREATAEEREREVDAKAAVVCLVKIKPGLPLGEFHQRLIVDLKADKQVTLEIPIIGTIVGDLSIAGQNYDAESRTLHMGHVSQANGKKLKLFLTAKGPHREDVKPTVNRVEPSDWLSITFDPPRRLKQGAAIMHVATVEVPAGSPFVNRLGTTTDHPPGRIVIQTNHPEIPEIDLKILFAVAQ